MSAVADALLSARNALYTFASYSRPRLLLRKIGGEELYFHAWRNGILIS